jgi:lipopolysaccharide transport system permease protein
MIGMWWMILQPLITMMIFTLVFGKLARLPSEGIPYPIFTYVALLPWQFFARCTSESTSCLIRQQQVISKVYFPRLLIPTASLLSALVDFLASLVVLAGLMAFYRVVPGWQVLMLPVFLFVAGTTALGIGLLLAGLAVRYRDVSIMLGFGLTIMQYLTPVAYSATLVPDAWRTLYRLNPMTVVVNGFRWSLLGTASPPDWTLGVAIAMAMVLLVAGAFCFSRAEQTIVDVL